MRSLSPPRSHLKSLRTNEKKRIAQGSPIRSIIDNQILVSRKSSPFSSPKRIPTESINPDYIEQKKELKEKDYEKEFIDLINVDEFKTENHYTFILLHYCNMISNLRGKEHRNEKLRLIFKSFVLGKLFVRFIIKNDLVIKYEKYIKTMMKQCDIVIGDLNEIKDRKDLDENFVLYIVKYLENLKLFLQDI